MDFGEKKLVTEKKLSTCCNSQRGNRRLVADYTDLNCYQVNQRPSRYQLRSSQSNQLTVPSTYGPRSFAVAGPTCTIWYNLPDYLRYPELSMDNFRRQLKTFLFAQYWRWHSSALETFVPVSYINSLFTLFTLHLSFMWLTCQRHNGEVANLLRTCCGKTVVINVGLYRIKAGWKLEFVHVIMPFCRRCHLPINPS